MSSNVNLMFGGVSRMGLVASVVLSAACGQTGDDAAPSLADGRRHWETIDQYCVDCHNSVEFTANLALDQMSPDEVADEPEVFEALVRKLRGGLMPPPGGPRPDQAEVDELVDWVERSLDAAANLHYEPVVLHRLNRKEYANAVRDLLAVEVDPGTLLPQDDQAEGFDNIAEALQVSPSFVEQFVSAARVVALQAVGQPDARAGSKTYNAQPGTQYKYIEGFPLGTRGGILANHHFPSDGEYRIDIEDMAQALWVDDMEFENTVIVTLDRQRIYQTVIGGEPDMKAIDQDQDPAVDAINARLKDIRFAATAGPHEVAVTFLRRTAAESDDTLQTFVPGGGQDHILKISSFQISGPYSPSGISATQSRDRIFVCYPKTQAEALPCAEEIIAAIATRAYRRPLTERDVGDALRYYREGDEEGGFESGIRHALTSILASPYFLYRFESERDDLVVGERNAVRGLDLASKLSFFLWNTIPDDELRGAAIQGGLDDAAVRKQQVQRMLADPRSKSLASDFAFQWLHLKRLEEVLPDRRVFPYASGDADPREDFVTELVLFVDSVFREDRSVVDLLTADYTYLNEKVALLYGINDVKGDLFRRVELTDTVRFGLLGKGAVLMASSYPNRTSPVLRGTFILEHILGAPPAPPPPNVEAFPENDVGTSAARTVREIMAVHRENPACFSCHGVMDPLGFALENFDAVGVWRDRDRFARTGIDSTAVLPDGTELSGPDDLRVALVGQSKQFVQTVVERLLTYALGRTVEYYDMPAVRKIVREAERDDYRFSAIVWGIVESKPFREREWATQEQSEAPEATTAHNESP